MPTRTMPTSETSTPASEGVGRGRAVEAADLALPGWAGSACRRRSTGRSRWPGPGRRPGSGSSGPRSARRRPTWRRRGSIDQRSLAGRRLSTASTLGEVLKRQHPRHHHQADHGIDEPVAFPGPVLDLLEGQIEHRPGQAAQREDQYAQGGICCRLRQVQFLTRLERTSFSYCFTSASQASPTGTPSSGSSNPTPRRRAASWRLPSTRGGRCNRPRLPTS